MKGELSYKKAETFLSLLSKQESAVFANLDSTEEERESIFKKHKVSRSTRQVINDTRAYHIKLRAKHKAEGCKCKGKCVFG